MRMLELNSKVRVIDVSAPLDGHGPYWPGSSGFEVRRETDVCRGDAITNSTLRMDVHVGTHVDAPAHHLRNGATVDGLSLEAMIGPAVVIEIDEGVGEITADVIADALGKDRRPERVLFKTTSGRTWGDTERVFDSSFVGLTLDGALWLAGAGVRLVGTDAQSIQRFGDPDDTHRVLFEAGAVILEGLDLRAASEGSYTLVCLPLLLVGAEAAPARVVLMEEVQP